MKFVDGLLIDKFYIPFPADISSIFVQAVDLAAGMASMMAVLVGAMHLALAILDLAAVVELFSQPLLRARTGAAALVVILAQAEVLFAVKLNEILVSNFFGYDPWNYDSVHVQNARIVHECGGS